MLTSVTDWNIPCVYIHVYWVTKNWRPGPYNLLRHADNRRDFLGLCLMQNWSEAHHVLLGNGSGKIWTWSSWEKGNFKWWMNSDMVKPEKFGHLHLVYHFTVPLSAFSKI